MQQDSTYPIDEDTREFAQHIYNQEIMQLIGRLRPANLEREMNPAEVYLLTGEAPIGLNIDVVTSLPEWMAGEDIEWLLQNKVPKRRVGSPSNESSSLQDSLDNPKRREAFGRIAEAIQLLRTEGVERLTDVMVSKKAGASRNTVATFKDVYHIKW